jgi:hypothetical protein
VIVPNKSFAAVLAFSLLSWLADVVIDGHLHVLNVPSGVFVVPMFAVPTIILLLSQPSKRVISAARIVLYVLAVPLVGALLPPMMDAPTVTDVPWSYPVMWFRCAQFIAGLFIAHWFLAKMKDLSGGKTI